ncbi:MAG: carboxypeptidase-like regulatory domain-containing protein, partial [Candidatus Solibacter sp.]|nr:carboxypeptidase-like regulatory domain-containing protein [Candidatus Solibacter sp.]
MSRRVVVCYGATALLAAMLSTAYAQDTGAINGQVFDPTQAAVPNTTVQAVNQDTGLSRKAVSNAEGAFFIQALPPGRYSLRAEVAGFKSSSQTGIQVSVGQNTRADIRLEVGTVAENVTVAADALAVDTQGSTVGATINRQLLANLPLLDLNVLSLASMLPGIAQATLPTVVTNSRQGPTVSVSGGRLRDNNFMLDGANLISTLYGTSQNLPAPDALEEFRVLTNTYAAEYGQGVGSVFLAVTKGGTNTPHGSLYEYFRNDAVNARNFFAATTPLLRQNQFGASFGAPVVLPHYNGKDRTFFFVSYQGLRLSSQAISTAFPATSQERVGNFSATAKAVIDPTTSTAFPVNIYNLYQPLLPNQSNGQNTTLISTRSLNNQVSIKGDQHLSASNNLSVRYFRNRDETINRSPIELFPVASAGTMVPVQSLTLSDTHTFRPVMLAELRLSYTRVNSNSSKASRVAMKNAVQLGGNFSQPAPVSPQVSISSRAGVSPGTPSREVDNVYQADAKLS